MRGREQERVTKLKKGSCGEQMDYALVFL